MDEAARPEGRTIALACLGRFGRLGNQVFQYLFLRLYSSRIVFGYRCPPWALQALFLGCETDRDLPDDIDAWPILADRIALSHPEWRAFALNREPLRSFVQPSKPLSGRDLRRLMPQVSGASLESGPPPAHDSVSLWGWFQFHTSAYAPFRPAIARLFAPRPAAATALAALHESLRGPARRRVIGLHWRCGAGYAPLSAVLAASAPAPSGSVPVPVAGPARCPGVSPGCAEFPDAGGVFWYLPLSRYADWLDSSLGSSPCSSPRPLVVLFTDSAHADAAVGSLRLILGDRYDVALPRDAGGDAWPPLVAALVTDSITDSITDSATDSAEFAALAFCVDDLLGSNSTFTAAAALIGAAAAAGDGAAGGGRRFYRPCPVVAALVPFDPFDSLPLLPAIPRRREHDRGNASSSTLDAGIDA